MIFLRNYWGIRTPSRIRVSPSPAFATMCAPISGRLGERYGPRAVAVPGAVVLVIGISWYLLALNSTPNYWIAFFPGSAITGIGVSMIFPMLSAAAVHDADVPRLSLASGTARTANQLGTAIGISLLFAALGEAPIALSQFRDGWAYWCGLLPSPVCSRQAFTAPTTVTGAPPCDCRASSERLRVIVSSGSELSSQRDQNSPRRGSRGIPDGIPLPSRCWRIGQHRFSHRPTKPCRGHA